MATILTSSLDRNDYGFPFLSTCARIHNGTDWSAMSPWEGAHANVTVPTSLQVADASAAFQEIKAEYYTHAIKNKKNYVHNGSEWVLLDAVQPAYQMYESNHYGTNDWADTISAAKHPEPGTYGHRADLFILFQETFRPTATNHNPSNISVDGQPVEVLYESALFKFWDSPHKASGEKKRFSLLRVQNVDRTKTAALFRKINSPDANNVYFIAFACYPAGKNYTISPEIAVNAGVAATVNQGSIPGSQYQRSFHFGFGLPMFKLEPGADYDDFKPEAERLHVEGTNIAGNPMQILGGTFGANTGAGGLFKFFRCLDWTTASGDYDFNVSFGTTYRGNSPYYTDYAFLTANFVLQQVFNQSSAVVTVNPLGDSDYSNKNRVIDTNTVLNPPVQQQPPAGGGPTYVPNINYNLSATSSASASMFNSKTSGPYRTMLPASGDRQVVFSGALHPPLTSDVAGQTNDWKSLTLHVEGQTITRAQYINLYIFQAGGWVRLTANMYNSQVSNGALRFELTPPLQLLAVAGRTNYRAEALLRW